MLSPGAATMTNCALVPLACGKVRLRIFSPSSPSVPGIENELSKPLMPPVAMPTPTEPPTTASSSSQPTSTRHG